MKTTVSALALLALVATSLPAFASVGAVHIAPAITTKASTAIVVQVARRGADDGVNHDVNDDKGGQRPGKKGGGKGRGGHDDGANHA